MAVGRTAKTLRLFVTCEDAVTKKTVVRMYDRDMNNELDALKKADEKQKAESTKNTTEVENKSGRNLNGTTSNQTAQHA